MGGKKQTSVKKHLKSPKFLHMELILHSRFESLLFQHKVKVPPSSIQIEFVLLLSSVFHKFKILLIFFNTCCPRR